MCAYLIVTPSLLDLLESESSILWSANVTPYKRFILQLRSGGLVSPNHQHTLKWGRNYVVVISSSIN
jgi:hypothetical protein